MDLKRCFKCGTDKPRTEFYRHPQMGDGLLGKCKDCARVDVTVHRASNVERIRAYDRNRANEPHRKTLRARVTKEWRAKHRDRTRAHSMAERQIPEGPPRCEGCNLSARLERHHPDYARPLLVVWLCKPCHSIADKIRRKTESEVA